MCADTCPFLGHTSEFHFDIFRFLFSPFFNAGRFSEKRMDRAKWMKDKICYYCNSGCLLVTTLLFPDTFESKSQTVFSRV